MQVPYDEGVAVAPIKTGERQWVRIPYGEGIAYHTGPESCAGARKDVGEALTGGMQAGLWSREIFLPWGADAVAMCGRQHGLLRNRER